MAKLDNNLFYYATKELSQDAFICWLCSYALRGEAEGKGDNVLAACAKDVIKSFLCEKENESDTEFELLRIDKQINNIDVLLSVSCNGKLYKIIVEDKINTSEHDNQLERYKKTVATFENVDDVIGVYFKMGFQSDYSKVKDAGYLIFNRNDFLRILEKYYSQTDNNIFRDYFEYWKCFDNEAHEYNKKSICDWNWRHINGFFEEMQYYITTEKNYWAGFGYVPNKSGGFWGMWYGPYDEDVIEYDDGSRCSLYLQVQIEWNYDENVYDYKICLKMSSIQEDGTKKIGDFKKNVVDIQKRFNFNRPRYMRAGRSMTVGRCYRTISND